MKVGIGFDAHRLVEGRKLFLGGVEIKSPSGLLGHSDGDVLLHALMDAILGAVSLGDIGKHFPPDDENYKGVSSLELLKVVKGFLMKNGKTVVNVDTVVICEEPRISEYAGVMQKQIAEVLEIDSENIGIKGTSTEGMGFTGRGEGISAIATVLIDDI